MTGALAPIDRPILEFLQTRLHATRQVSRATVTAADDDREYTITPTLIAAIGRRTTDDDIDTYIDRHGIAGLATALTYAVARERGEVTHRLMAQDLDVSPLAAEIILQALRPVVHEYFDIEESGASVADIEGVGEDVDRDVAGDNA